MTMFADFYGNENASLTEDSPNKIVQQERDRDQLSESALSQTSLDEDNFFKNVPRPTSFLNTNIRHSQDSDLALNSSSSSWNEEIFQNAFLNLEILSTSSQSIEETEYNKCPFKSSSPPNSFTKTTDTM